MAKNKFYFLLLLSFQLRASDLPIFYLHAGLEGKNEFLFSRLSLEEDIRPPDQFQHLVSNQIFYTEHLVPVFSHQKCVQRVEPGNSRALSRAIASSPEGCVLEIEGIYIVNEHWNLKTQLRPVTVGTNNELTEYGAFYFSGLDGISTEKTDYQAAILNSRSAQSVSFPRAILIPSEEVAEHWLSVMPGGGLNGIGVIPGSLTEVYGCLSTGIQVSVSVSKKLHVGFPESSLPGLCSREHYQGVIPGNGQPSPGNVAGNGGGSSKQNQGANPSGSSSSESQRETGSGASGFTGNVVSGAGAAGDEDDDDEANRPWAWAIAEKLEKRNDGLLLSELYKELEPFARVKRNKKKTQSRRSMKTVTDSTKGWKNSIRHNLSVHRYMFTDIKPKGCRGGRWKVADNWRTLRSSTSGRARRMKAYNGGSKQSNGGSAINTVTYGQVESQSLGLISVVQADTSSNSYQAGPADSLSYQATGQPWSYSLNTPYKVDHTSGMSSTGAPFQPQSYYGGSHTSGMSSTGAPFQPQSYYGGSHTSGMSSTDTALHMGQPLGSNPSAQPQVTIHHSGNKCEMCGHINGIPSTYEDLSSPAGQEENEPSASERD